MISLKRAERAATSPQLTPEQLADREAWREALYARLDARVQELHDFFVSKGVAYPPPEHAHRSRLGRLLLLHGGRDEAWTAEARRLEAERLAALAAG